MTTVDLRSWGPTAAAPSATLSDLVVEDDTYVGRHRKPGLRSLSVMRMMYHPRHRRP